MKKVFLRYNPYKLETEITVDGKKLKQNSKIGDKIAPGARLQEWVEEMPRILIDEYNDTDFEVKFHGTLLDYEDLTAAFTEACERQQLTAKFEHKPAKETTDKEILIDDVFKEIQEGPFDELRDIEIISAFKHAKSRDFEVCVVAIMSAGKSTLINAMLGKKLLPSRQEACTAIITRIKDISKDDVSWQAKAYNKDEQLVEEHETLTYQIMKRLNADEKVSEVRVIGNIPFISSEDVSLVLIDTPGPNYSRDPNHKKVQSEFLGKSSKSLVLYIMTGEFGTDDDHTLLKRVAESMAVGGKQSKDRFIFVVNKLDDRKEEDGDTEHTLERVRSYLNTHGISKPHLFPAAALPALNLRLIASNAEVDEDTKDETEMKVRRLKRNETLHFETYASLPKSIRCDIAQQLTQAKESENADEEALIHTGITSVEAAIRQYVQKYAKTAKIKNIVDTFMHKLDEVGCFEETKSELAKNRDESEKIVKQIDLIRKKIDDVKLAKNFKDAVDDAVVKVNDDSKKGVEGIIKKFQSRIPKEVDNLHNKELTIEVAKEELERLKKFENKLKPDFEVELEELIHDYLVKTSSCLLEEYRQKLASLTEEIDFGSMGISIDPLKLMSNSVIQSDYSFRHLIREDERVVGHESYQVKEKIRGWLESIAFWPKYEYVTKYKDVRKTVKYINGSDLAKEFSAHMKEALNDNGEKAQKYVRKQSKHIVERFNSEFKKLNSILKSKLNELESYATDKEKAEERMVESERKLKWLDQIKGKVEAILEI